jgi:3-methyladenine DNA glycosylase AlkD
MHPYLQPLIASLEAAANPTLAGPMEKYMKNHFTYYGIKSPQRKEIFRAFIKAYGLPPVAALEDIIEALWEMPYRECHYVAIDLLDKMQKKLEPKHLPMLEEMLTTNSWWDTVDILASHQIGGLLKKYPELIPENTERWINSDNFWLQRVAIIYQLGYKNDTDAERLFRYCKMRAGSKEFFIRKGIGWALRQYSYTNPNAVIQFVAQNDLSPLSQREALKGLKRLAGRR